MSEPRRVMLDLSELPTGTIPESSDYESDDHHSMTNLVRTLVDQFEVNPPRPHLDDLNDNRNEVTIASTEANENEPREGGNLEDLPTTTEADNSSNNNENPLFLISNCFQKSMEIFSELQKQKLSDDLIKSVMKDDSPTTKIIIENNMHAYDFMINIKGKLTIDVI